MSISQHARRRMQQRAIPSLMLEIVFTYGREELQDGASVVYLDRRARERAKRDIKDLLARFDKLEDTYLVAANDTGSIVTAGHRRHRVRRR